jgi:hypothetical protein
MGRRGRWSLIHELGHRAAAWAAAAIPQLAALTAEAPRPGIVDVPEQWLVLATCRDENQQVEMLERLRREGVECRALVA